jgi:hypothetical protein
LNSIVCPGEPAVKVSATERLPHNCYNRYFGKPKSRSASLGLAANGEFFA